MNIPHLNATQGGGIFSIKIITRRKNGYCRLLLENRLNLFEFILNLSGFIFNLFGKRLNLSGLLIGQS
ncbi:MAG: hypothetical protein WC679_03715 [Bacteroidales bacterium]|jgi:hypothetical protein